VLGEAALELLGQEALAQILSRTRGAAGEMRGQRTRECDVEPPALIVEQVEAGLGAVHRGSVHRA
jgi:hypothetical protein